MLNLSTVLKRTAITAVATAVVYTPLSAVADSDLTLQVYNPGEKSMFPVTSTLITGDNEAMLIDAQFQRNDAQALVKMIRDSGKKLTTVFISAADPDFYFGLDVIKTQFPDVTVLASEETIKKIQQTIVRKEAYWGPILGENAPQMLVIPKPLKGDTLSVDGEQIKVVGLDGPDPAHAFLWIPESKTVLGGVALYDNMHVWVADTQTQESRDHWRGTLDSVTALQPERVIPGHYLGANKGDLTAINYTYTYVTTFEKASAKAANSAELIDAMESHYPGKGGTGSLQISAKVLEGEMKWPQ
ncbi:MBL fold metallo-hydrolase [Pontibacterium sp.]|uniref:MBL fold metallo-hydrolase n=1 Tax=Pontibacterium sp. TaxID=2036026 RepID=UPI0035675DA5